MKIIYKQESRESCSEAGWFAIDCQLDEPLNSAFILSLRPLGNFVYLDMLKQPFFKIESDYYMIKGVQGNNYFRIAYHGEHADTVKKIEHFMEVQGYEGHETTVV